MSSVRDDPQEQRLQSGPTTVVAVSLAEGAAARIAQMISSGELRPGDRLPPERELALSLGVSRGALREGLASLESAGLLHARVGHGRFVALAGSENASSALTSFTQLQPIGDVIAMRRLLEPAAVRDIPAIKVADVAAEAGTALQAMRRAAARRQYAVAASAHSSFHHALVRYAATRLHRLLLVGLISASETAELEVLRDVAAAKHSLARHQAIVDPLMAGDVEEAAQQVEEHLEPAFTYPADLTR
jgi:GntR family transcriptional repressor for pyruvate dehydrogenase complex